MPHRTRIPAGYWQPVKVNAEHQPEKWQNHERWNGNARDRKRHAEIVGGGMLMKRGKRAQQYAQDQGQRDRNGTDLEGHRKPLADQLRDREILVLEGRPEIPVQQRLEIAAVLNVDRLIESIGALDIGLDLRRDRLLLIEWTAGRQAHQKESDGNDDEQRRNGTGEPREEEARHLRMSLSADRKVDKGTGSP